jgi:CRP-like cAMP-binding protein
MSELKKHIIDTFNFSKKEFENIQEFFRPVEIKKGDFFLEQGQYSRQLGFVEKGILREFLYVNGKEITKWFSTTGYFAVDLSGFLNKELAKVNYQAQTDTKLLVISKEDYGKIGEIIPQWDKLEKLFLTKCFSVLENRVISHLAMNAEERYKQLFDFQPMLFNQVPLNYIASMLGMTPETLSRIRHKLSNSNS